MLRHGVYVWEVPTQSKSRSYKPEPAPVIDRIEIRSLPDKTSFFAGEALDYTGVSVVAVMNDGTERDVTADCTFDPADGTIVIVV